MRRTDGCSVDLELASRTTHSDEMIEWHEWPDILSSAHRIGVPGRNRVMGVPGNQTTTHAEEHMEEWRQL
eukprot:7378569-Prymnesium_polylepis.1